jgi:ribosomal protein S18 acetylase RimI-like enzyme
MRRDLTQPVAPAFFSGDVALVAFDPRLAQACRVLMNRVYAEGFGDVVPFETWWPKLNSDAEYDPALCFVAAREGAIVGFCQCWTEPFVKDIVVDGGWRGRGLGAALLTAAMTAYVARGASFVDLKTDVDNVKAQALYRRLGFVVVAKNA